MAGGRKSGSESRRVAKGKQGRNPDLARYMGNGNILPTKALVEREQRQVLDRWKAATRKAVRDLPTIVARRIHCNKMQLVLMQLAASVARRVHGQRLHCVSRELKRVMDRRVHGQRLRPVLSELTTLLNRRSHHTELRPVLGELVTLINRRIHVERLRPVLISLTASVAARVVSPDTINEGSIDAPPEAVTRKNGSPSPAPPRPPAAEMPPDQPLAEDDTRARSNTARRTSDGPLMKADEAAVEKDAVSGGGDIDAHVEVVDEEGKPGEKPVGAAGVSKSMLTIVVDVMEATASVAARAGSPDTVNEGPIDAPEAVTHNGSPSPAQSSQNAPRTAAAEMPPDQPPAEDDTRARSNTARRTSDGPLVKADEAAVDKNALSGGGDLDAQVEDVGGEKPVGAAGVSKSILTLVVEYVMDALGRIVEGMRGVGSLLRRGVAAGLSLVARVM